MVGILVSGISLAYNVDARSYASCSIETALDARGKLTDFTPHEQPSCKSRS
jgi:hypothetical protein